MPHSALQQQNTHADFIKVLSCKLCMIWHERAVTFFKIVFDLQYVTGRFRAPVS